MVQLLQAVSYLRHHLCWNNQLRCNLDYLLGTIIQGAILLHSPMVAMIIHANHVTHSETAMVACIPVGMVFITKTSVVGMIKNVGIRNGILIEVLVIIGISNRELSQAP